MGRSTLQFCHVHKTMEPYPAHDIGYANAVRWSKPAELPPAERPIVWEHPVTGEHKTPGRNDVPMPERYKQQGYVKREFKSYQEHRAWTEAKGLVSHKVEGIKDSVLEDQRDPRA
jgi:hypothetical protein